jgi:hypothetical protein
LLKDKSVLITGGTGFFLDVGESRSLIGSRT